MLRKMAVFVKVNNGRRVIQRRSIRSVCLEVYKRLGTCSSSSLKPMCRFIKCNRCSATFQGMDGCSLWKILCGPGGDFCSSRPTVYHSPLRQDGWSLLSKIFSRESPSFSKKTVSVHKLALRKSLETLWSHSTEVCPSRLNFWLSLNHLSCTILGNMESSAIANELPCVSYNDVCEERLGFMRGMSHSKSPRLPPTPASSNMS